jgi:hypothetical protein
MIELSALSSGQAGALLTYFFAHFHQYSSSSGLYPFLHLEWITKTLRMMRKVTCSFSVIAQCMLIYKSQTAVAKLMSLSSAGRKLTTTLLL